MTLASDLRAMLPGIRAIPGELGLRPHSVSLIEREWDSDIPGEGNYSDILTEITENGQNPKVRWFNNEQLAVGALETGTVNIGPVTPDGSISLEEIRIQTAEQGTARYVLITGPMHPTGAKYRITKITAHRTLQWMIEAKPVDAESF